MQQEEILKKIIEAWEETNALSNSIVEEYKKIAGVKKISQSRARVETIGKLLKKREDWGEIILALEKFTQDET